MISHGFAVLIKHFNSCGCHILSSQDNLIRLSIINNKEPETVCSRDAVGHKLAHNIMGSQKL